MTQDELAAAIGKTRDTIAKAEGNRGGWTKRTAREVFAVLNRSRMSEADAHAFLDHFELARSLYDAAPLPPSAQAPRVQSTETHPIGTEIAEAATLFGQLLQRFGPRKSIEILKEAIAQEPGYIDSDQVLNVRYPARPSPTVPGAIEEQHVTYSRQPAPKSTAAIKRAGKTPRPGS